MTIKDMFIEVNEKELKIDRIVDRLGKKYGVRISLFFKIGFGAIYKNPKHISEFYIKNGSFALLTYNKECGINKDKANEIIDHLNLIQIKEGKQNG